MKMKKFSIRVQIGETSSGSYAACVSMGDPTTNRKKIRRGRERVICAISTSPRTALREALRKQVNSLNARKGHKRYGGK